MRKFLVEIKWGITFFAVILVWAFIERLFGLYGPHIDKYENVSFLFVFPAVLIYILALLNKRRKDFDDKMNWIQGFISGLIITFVVALLTPLSQMIIHYFIAPEYFKNAIDFTVEQGDMTQAEAEAYFNLNTYIYMSVQGALIMGAVTSAIVALFVRKK